MKMYKCYHLDSPNYAIAIFLDKKDANDFIDRSKYDMGITEVDVTYKDTE